MPGIYVDLIVSSSQERYEIGIIIIILSIWQIRKRIQVNTANKSRAQKFNPSNLALVFYNLPPST